MLGCAVWMGPGRLFNFGLQVREEWHTGTDASCTLAVPIGLGMGWQDCQLTFIHFALWGMWS